MIYLDNAATSHPKPERVYDAACAALRNASANPSRSGHRMAADAGRAIFEAREGLARLFGSRHPERFVFTANATTALNAVLLGFLDGGDHCLTTSVEHNAVLRPLNILGQAGVHVEKVACDSSGVLDPTDLAAAVTARTRLIVVTHASNVSGALTPLADVAELARRCRIPLLVDASQTAGTVPIDVEALVIDFLACPGHKGLLGPQGTGVLYIAPHRQLRPTLFGGTGGHSADPWMPDFLPDRHEAGTMNTPGIAGLGAAAEYLLTRGVASVRAYEVELCGRLMEGLRTIPDVRLYGPSALTARSSVVSFTMGGLDPADAGDRLDETFDIAVRVGLHCAPDAHQTLGTFPEGTIRMSPGCFTTPDEIDAAVAAVRALAQTGRQTMVALEPATS